MNAGMASICSAALLTAFVAAAQDATWETVSIPGICTYQIPPTVEIQRGGYKKLNVQYRKSILEIETSLDRVVAQPKGINGLDSVALSRYCRIIVDTEKGSRGDYPKLGTPLAFSVAELKEVDKVLRNKLQEETSLSASKGLKMTILSWQPAKITRVNGVDAMLTIYRRSMNDAPPVLVSVYQIPNNDCLHTVTVSYRESEKELWADDLGKVISTFKFKKR